MARLPPARDRLCVRCGKPAESWQHRVAAGKGGPDDLWNCVPLCGDGTRGCHGRAESHVTEARELGLDVPGSLLRGRYVGPDLDYRLVYPDPEESVAVRLREKFTPTYVGCWEWEAYRTPKGYGEIGEGRSARRAHRVAWAIANREPVPPGTWVLHRCDNPPCVRPTHLVAGTAAENTAQMMDRGRNVAPTGLANGRAVLSDDDVRDIRAAAAEGARPVDLAREWDLDRGYVSRLIRRERRAEVGP